MADLATKKVVLESMRSLQVLVALLKPTLLDHSAYSQGKNDWVKQELATLINKNGGCCQQYTILPASQEGNWL